MKARAMRQNHETAPRVLRGNANRPALNHAQFEFAVSDIDELEVLGTRPPFGRNTLRDLDVRGLHCGCGMTLFPGWVNTDRFHLVDRRGNRSRVNRIARLNRKLYYLPHDAAKSFPFESRLFDWVYAEHFIEHLSCDRAIGWLKEVRRLLKPCGVLRLTTPDLARYVEGYLDSRRRFYVEHRRRVQHLFPAGAPQRRAWMMNQIFYCWGHRWLYDFDEIVYAAGQAGFTTSSVTRCSFQQGSVPDICQLDWDFRSDETLYVELTKIPPQHARVKRRGQIRYGIR